MSEKRWSIVPKEQVNHIYPSNLSFILEIASDFLKGRVFEVSLGDLNDNEADFRKFRLICEDVKGRNCLTNFHGMNFTRDKLSSIVKKWHVSSLILAVYSLLDLD